MYKYDAIDQQIVNERVAQYRDQTNRYLAGELSEDEFRPLRLQNGLRTIRSGLFRRTRDGSVLCATYCCASDYSI